MYILSPGGWWLVSEEEELRESCPFEVEDSKPGASATQTVKLDTVLLNGISILSIDYLNKCGCGDLKIDSCIIWLCMV